MNANIIKTHNFCNMMFDFKGHLRSLKVTVISKNYIFDQSKIFNYQIRENFYIVVKLDKI